MQIRNETADWISKKQTTQENFPPCSNGTQYWNIIFGFASCYYMDATTNELLWAACDIPTQTSCYKTYRICRENGGVTMVLIEEVEEGVVCPESVADWIVDPGSYARPCMRYCN